MVVNNPNNWHWVDKNCLAWSKEYFDEKLLNLSVEDETSSASISNVSSVEGDVDVSQRKGKVISLFDLRLVLTFSGHTDKDDKVSGSITIPELAYDSDEKNLVFNITVYNESRDNASIVDLIKKKLVPKLREILMNFGPDLIATNSKDIQLEADKITSTFTKANQEKSVGIEKPETKSVGGAEKPETKSVGGVEKPESKSASKPVVSSNSPKYNTTTLHLEPAFNTTAEQIYITLLDESRIAAWTRSNPIIEKFPPKVGSTFKFFNGAVQGKILKLVPNEEIVELWRLDDWKEGHYAELNIKLKQSSGETKMVVKFTGVPIGEEDRVKDNFEDMYIRSIKITFGFGAVL
ncbi:AHA1 [Candida oxycetoniae]|uniref:AHA1 n=1 Tax=Candida oxycetoniae TaxID=497107 RepID=A0AAI9X0F3_9ASCO|nr:AHA1 [Candida oxycetoniae]KAI3406970.1 AHA1 [Candida oxycetoniae]